MARTGESEFGALAVDAIEPSAPVLLQRLRKRLEAFSGASSRWGPLELRMAARFWAGKGARTFAEFLDEVEAGVRAPEPEMTREEEEEGKMTMKVKEP